MSPCAVSRTRRSPFGLVRWTRTLTYPFRIAKVAKEVYAGDGGAAASHIVASCTAVIISLKIKVPYNVIPDAGW